MLADISINVQAGRFGYEIQLPSTSKMELMEFIASEIPRWRDHPDRPLKQAETTLTEHLCDYLNVAASQSTIWSYVQFRTETSDEVQSNRKIDVSVKPRVAAIVIEGRRHSQFDALFPIECKRLPTPMEAGRDEREYVITKSSTTGGIQRFKFGHHGAAHRFAAMIAYVQEQSFPHWLNQVNGWIQNLSSETDSRWSVSDSLQTVKNDSATGVCTLHSHHERGAELGEIDLRHLWIKMN